MTEDAVAGLVIHLARRPLDRLEDDVLVEARRHPLGEPQSLLIDRIELFARDLVLVLDDLRRALRGHDTERRGELAHAQTEPLDAVVRLAVVAKRARKIDQLRVLRD